MIRAAAIRHRGSWPGRPADSVTLTHHDRNRRRLVMQGDGGLSFLLDLPEAAILRDGDALVLDDGRLVEVRARPEALLDIRARDAHHLARLAWHLGNRHIPAAMQPGHILIRPDHVIAAMLIGLGATVAAVEAPFDPEGGAYAGHALAVGLVHSLHSHDS